MQPVVSLSNKTGTMGCFASDRQMTQPQHIVVLNKDARSRMRSEEGREVYFAIESLALVRLGEITTAAEQLYVVDATCPTFAERNYVIVFEVIPCATCKNS
jgi:hypothetical protein